MGVQLPSEPINRHEQYLAKIAGQAVEIPAEPLTREEAYLDYIAKHGGGGGGGTNDYDELLNQPKINDVTLKGNKSASDLGLASASALANKVDKVAGKGLSTNDYSNEDKAIVGGVTAALAGKQDALTAGNNIKIDDDTISVNRWAVPVGKVVYTVITSDENYGRNVHVQRHTLGGEFIDDRTFLCEMYKTVNIDGLISIQNPYSSFNITLLKDSDEQQAGYSYNVNPLTTPTSNSFTFMMEQEENDNDLIIRSELDAKQDTLTFDNAPTENSNNPVKSGGVYSALAGKVNTENGKGLSTNDYSDTEKAQVATNADDISTLKSGLTNLDNEVNGDATVYPYADVITIENAVPSNLADCSVKVEPVQDLHGQSAPYVGGAGKNKLPMTVDGLKAANTEGTWNGNTYTKDNATFVIGVDSANNVISITGTGNGLYGTTISLPFVLSSGSYILSSGFTEVQGSNDTLLNDGSSVIARGNATAPGPNFSLESDTNITWYFRVSAGSAFTCYPMIRLSTETDSTFAPYSNICPISGHTEVDVDVHHPSIYTTNNTAGMNQQSFVDILSNNSFRVYTTANKTYVSSKQLLSMYNLEIGKKYTMEADAEITSGTAILSIRDNVNSILAQSDHITTSGHLVCTFTFTSEMNYLSFFATYDSSIIGDVTYKNIKFYEGEPKTYTLALGDTIYGGKVRIDSNGNTVMDSDRVYDYIDGSDTTRLTVVNGQLQIAISSDSKTTTDLYHKVGDLLCNRFDEIYSNSSATNGIYYRANGSHNLLVRGNDYTAETTLSDWVTWLGNNPLQIVYGLATPTTIQLTPQQIQLLQGTNTLYASTGDISVSVNGVSGAIGQVQEQVNDNSNAVEELLKLTVGTQHTTTASDGGTVIYTEYSLGARMSLVEVGYTPGADHSAADTVTVTLSDLLHTPVLGFIVSTTTTISSSDRTPCIQGYITNNKVLNIWGSSASGRSGGIMILYIY